VCSVLISESPMRYNKNSHLFQGLLLVILEESGQSQSKKLSQPVSFAVASDADEVVPKDASIDHSNFPPLEIRFASLNPSDSVQLTFITSTNPQGYRKYLPVEPILSVEAADTVLEGFGIERTNITVTMNPPTPMATYCEPSYGAGTSAGSGSGSEPSVPGAKVPFVSAQSARSMPDSAIARACALVIWFMAMAGSLALKAKKATVSAVSNIITMSVIGSAIPSSGPRRRARELVIDSSGERGLRRPQLVRHV